jgi:diguanylate cyclase (GGDEF)-like protein
LNGADSSIPLLVTAAGVCLLFMLIAGGIVYGNTRRTITAADWVEHTQEVLNSLRTTSQTTERVESNTRLYLATADVARLDLAKTSAASLESEAGRLKELVSDNANQTPSVEQLIVASAELTQNVASLHAGGELPKNSIQHCQQAISKMTAEERRLLTERTKTSQRISIVSLTTDFIFASLSVLTLITLFGFLLRAAELRQRTESQILETNRNLERSIELLQEQADESNLLTTSRDELQLCVTLPEVYESAKNGFARLIPQTSGALCMLNNSRNVLETVSSWGEPEMEDCIAPGACCGMRSGQPRWRQPSGSEINCTHFATQAPAYYICVPVVAHGDTLGLLYIQCKDEAGMQSVRLRLGGMRQLTQLTGMAVASMKLRIKLENQSIRDPLTSLFNRTFMEIALERELSRAVRRKSMIAVMMLDVDHFKLFNDTHGHAAGDAVLKAVAEVCQNTVRSEDIVCRYGGEEFTMILPDMTVEAAGDRAESIRRAIEALRVRGDRVSYGDVTASIGVALYPDDGMTAEVLLRKADLALYRAKQQGRNQVSLCIEPTLLV